MTGSQINIPEYKKLTIGGYTLIMDDDIAIKVSSKYGPLWESQSSDLLTLLASSVGLPSGQFALQGVQIWKSVDPVTFSVTASLYMDSAPYDDVVVPTFKLMSCIVPSISTSADETLAGLLEGVAENILGIKLKTLIPPGPNLQTLLSMASTGDGKGLLGKMNSLNKATKRGVFTVKMGFLTIPNVLLTGVEPTFSKEVAPQTVNGVKGYYPVSASLSLEFSTMEVATVDMLSGWTYNTGNTSLITSADAQARNE